MKVGLIGVGLMGHGIAKNIVTKGWELSFLDQVGNQSTTDLLELGAKPYDKAVDLAAASDVLVLCVTINVFLTSIFGIFGYSTMDKSFAWFFLCLFVINYRGHVLPHRNLALGQE